MPSSLTAVCGLLRPISRVSSPATRMSDREVSATSARHPTCNHRPRTGCGTAGCRSVCRRRSRLPEQVCPSGSTIAKARSRSQRRRHPQVLIAISAAASCAWALCPPAPADIREPVAEAAALCRQFAQTLPQRAIVRPRCTYTGSPGDSRRPGCTSDARSGRDVHGHGRRHPA